MNLIPDVVVPELHQNDWCYVRGLTDKGWAFAGRVVETCLGQYYDVYVPCRNPRLLCDIFQPHHCAVLLNFHWGWGSHLISLWTTYEPHPQQKFGNAVLQTWWRNQNMRWNIPLCKTATCIYVCLYVDMYVLRNLRFCAISRLRCAFSESLDCVTHVRNLEIAHAMCSLKTFNYASTSDSERSTVHV